MRDLRGRKTSYFAAAKESWRVSMNILEGLSYSVDGFIVGARRRLTARTPADCTRILNYTHGAISSAAYKLSRTRERGKLS